MQRPRNPPPRPPENPTLVVAGDALFRVRVSDRDPSPRRDPPADLAEHVPGFGWIIANHVRPRNGAPPASPLLHRRVRDAGRITSDRRRGKDCRRWDRISE
jgi:hypothetical protein